MMSVFQGRILPVENRIIDELSRFVMRWDGQVNWSRNCSCQEQNRVAEWLPLSWIGFIFAARYKFAQPKCRANGCLPRLSSSISISISKRIGPGGEPSRRPLDRGLVCGQLRRLFRPRSAHRDRLLGAALDSGLRTRMSVRARPASGGGGGQSAVAQTTLGERLCQSA